MNNKLLEKEEDTQSYNLNVKFSSKKSDFLYNLPNNSSIDVLVEKLQGNILQFSGHELGSEVFSYEKIKVLHNRWKQLTSYLQSKGIIGTFKFDKVFTDEILLYFFDVFSPQNTNIVSDSHFTAIFGRGFSENPEEALSKGIGEILERYPLSIYREEDLIRGSIEHLKQKNIKYIDPFALSVFSDDQKKKRPELQFDHTSVFNWVWGKSLLNKERILIPAQLIFLGYCFHRKDKNEPILREPNTNGAAGHFTQTKAILSGLYELIHRDAFLAYWLNTVSPQIIDQTSIHDSRIQDLLEKAKRLHFEVTFLDVTSDIKVPTCICAIHDKSGVGPRVIFGGGCSFNSSEAIHRSLVEAISIYHGIRGYTSEYTLRLPQNYEPFMDPSFDTIKRVLLWSNPKMFEKIAFLFKGSEISYENFSKVGKLFRNDNKELKEIIKLLKKLGDGYEPYYFEANNSVLNDLGYFSIKTIVPKLIPLYYDDYNAALGSTRIQESVYNMGIKQKTRLNPYPHPFP